MHRLLAYCYPRGTKATRYSHEIRYRGELPTPAPAAASSCLGRSKLKIKLHPRLSALWVRRGGLGLSAENFGVSDSGQQHPGLMAKSCCSQVTV